MLTNPNAKSGQEVVTNCQYRCTENLLSNQKDEFIPRKVPGAIDVSWRPGSCGVDTASLPTLHKASY